MTFWFHCASFWGKDWLNGERKAFLQLPLSGKEDWELFKKSLPESLHVYGVSVTEIHRRN